MFWILVIACVVALFAIASASRRAKQRAAVAGFRRHFPPIAWMRLAAACPQLEGVLRETELRLLFDWILIHLYRRTGSSGFGELMQWFVEHDTPECLQLVGDVSREAVDRLPQPVLRVIDGCGGREYAAVMIDQSLTEAGERIGPALNRNHV